MDLGIGSGSVEVRGLWGGGSISSGSGRLTLLGLGGKVDAYSGSGGIDMVELKGTLRATIYARTSSGDMDRLGR